MTALVANSGHQVAWTRQVGHVLFDYVNVEIGVAIIDTTYGQWFTIYNELTQTEEKKDGYDVIIASKSNLPLSFETDNGKQLTSRESLLIHVSC